MEDEKYEVFQFEQNSMFSESFLKMEEIRREGKFCDVILKVDGESLSAHKIVLCATIPYFHAMFMGNMKESNEDEVTILGVDPHTVRAFVNFAYTGKLEINVDTVHALLTGASFFQLDVIRQACADFLSKRLQMYNVLGINKWADLLECITLLDACQNYIQQNFYEVSLGQEFLNLDFDDILDVLSCDDLHVSSEEVVFEALMRWIKQDFENRKKHFPVLLSKVRLPLLSPQYLTDKVAKEELIRSSLECRDLLDEAREYHLIPERRLLLQSFKTQPRCCKSMTGFIFAIGGLKVSGESLEDVEMYDPIAKTWSFTNPMHQRRSRVGVAVLNNCVYAVGGYDGSQRLASVEFYDPYKKIWAFVSPMHCTRSAGGAAALKDKLYVCGGYDGISSLNSVECFNPEVGEWELVTPMVKHRSACGVVAFDGYLYALGGHDGLTIFDLVERYDPNTKKWTEVTQMLTKRCRLGAASLNGKLYACGGYDGSTFLETVEMYDPKENKWKMVAPMNTKRSRVGLVANMGKLWAIGGYDGESNLSTVEIYDPKLDKWSFGSPMSEHEGGVGVGVIPFSDLCTSDNL